jgi:hypothetical protein
MPIPLVAAVGVAVLVARALYRAMKDDVGDGERKVPAEVHRTVLRLKLRQATAAEVRGAAVLCDRERLTHLAELLRSEADVLEGVEGFSSGLPTKQLEDCGRRESPFDGVSNDDWSQYVKRARTARLGSVSRSYRLGCYQVTARELSDVGVMTDAHKGDYQGRTCWVGQWVSDKAEGEFLASPSKQYDVLVALTRLHGKAIEARYPKAVGQEIEGQRATMSGLLGVARKAGIGGLGKWIADEKDRAAFCETTAQYHRFNGIF